MTTTNHHDHFHFKCQACGKTTCLDDVYIPSLKLPQELATKEMNLLIRGGLPCL